MCNFSAEDDKRRQLDRHKPDSRPQNRFPGKADLMRQIPIPTNLAVIRLVSSDKKSAVGSPTASRELLRRSSDKSRKKSFFLLIPIIR